MRRDPLPKLRQRLRAKIVELDRILKPGFETEPVFPGSLHVSRHRCGKAQCRCANGDLHEVMRLQIRFNDGIANRCVSEEEAASWKPRTKAYKRMRETGRSFRKWQKEVLELLEGIERQRRSLEGLSEEDRKRPLR